MKIPNGFKAHTLILLHLNGANMPKQYREIVEEMLKDLHVIVDYWFKMGRDMHQLFMMRRFPKNMTPKAMCKIIEFSQHLTQGLWKDSDPMLMLPCTTMDTLKKLKKVQKSNPDLQQFIRMTDEERQQLDVYTATELVQVNQVCRQLPQYKMEVKIENNSNVAQRDFLAIEVTIT